MPLQPHRGPALAALAASLLLLATTFACSDTPTQPRLLSPTVPTAQAPNAVTINPASFTVTLGTEGSTTGRFPATGGSIPNGPYYERRTLVELSLGSDMVTATRYDDPTRSESWGPNGVLRTGSTTCKSGVLISWNSSAGEMNGPGDACKQAGAPRRLVFYGDKQASLTRDSYDMGTCGSPAQPCYKYSGQHTVTLTPVKATLSLTASPGTGIIGDSVTFTLLVTPDTVDGKSVPFSITAQRWVPDAGTGTTTACGFRQLATRGTCVKRIMESGRMEVDAFVNGTPVTVSEHVTVTTPKLALSCTPKLVLRGGNIVCTAATVPVDPAFRVTGWRFDASGPTLPPVVRSDANTTSTTWSGIVGAGGTVTVSAIVNERDTSATASFEIEPRPWPASPMQLPGIPTDGGSGPLSLTPINGEMEFGRHSLVGPSTFIEALGTGPNAGYRWLAEQPQWPRSIAYINAALDGQGDWAAMQTGTYNGSSVSPSGLPYCTSSAFAPLRTEAQRHEGLTGASNSHHGIWQAALSTGALDSTIERIVAAGPVAEQASDSIAAWANRINVNEHVPFDVAEYQLITTWSGNCAFVY